MADTVVNIVPDMYGYTSPSGTVSCDYAYTSNEGWRAFNRDNSDKWTTDGTTGWLAYEATASYRVHKYTIVGCVSGQTTYALKNWTFEGWNGTGYDTLDTRTNETGWGVLEKRTYYLFTPPALYAKYRINITANNGSASYTTIVECEIFTGWQTEPLFIISNRSRREIVGYKVAAPYSPTDFAPRNMTNATTPSPYVVSQSGSTGSSFDAWHAFDNSVTSYWVSNVNTGWIKLYIGTTAKKLISYAVRVNTVPEPNRAPKDWTLQGSNNDSDWETLDTVTGQTSWGSGETRTFYCDVIRTYSYFKIVITLNNGDTYLQTAELYLYAGEQSSYNHLVPRRSRYRRAEISAGGVL